MKKIADKKNRFLSGFTLVEMLIVSLIFSIVIGTVLGIFISAIRLQRYSLAVQQLINQTGYVMEYVSRALRMAKKQDAIPMGPCITTGTNYEATASSIKFNKPSEDVAGNQIIVCKEFSLSAGRLIDKESGRGDLVLTSSKVQVTSFKIQAEDGVSVQPRVTLYLEMENNNVTPAARIKIQTTVSQRDLNIVQ